MSQLYGPDINLSEVGYKYGMVDCTRLQCQNQILQALGFDFRIAGWPQLQAVLVQTQKYHAETLTLYLLVRDQAQNFEDEFGAVVDDKDPRSRFKKAINAVSNRLVDKIALFGLVRRTAEFQFIEIARHQPTVNNAEFDTLCLFALDQRPKWCRFRHDNLEMLECLDTGISLPRLCEGLRYSDEGDRNMIGRRNMIGHLHYGDNAPFNPFLP